MEVIYTAEDLKLRLQDSGGSVGFVPTMGALHMGHMSLIKRAKADCKQVVASVFVNPTQFNNAEDLKKYPRTLEKDCELLEKNDCDIVFAPSVEEMYPVPAVLKFDFGPLENVMEGAHRAGHFNGVGLVVSKLFHMVNPHKAYFGQKDLQQVAIINRLTKDLSFPIEIIPCPTVREENGLAMSSRNARLSQKGKEQAGIIYECLKTGEKMLKSGKEVHEVRDFFVQYYKKFPEFSPEYTEIVDFETLQPLPHFSKENKTAICTAVFFEGVRLIDNVLF